MGGNRHGHVMCAVVMALASAGCIGSSSSSTPTGSSDDLGLIPLKTALTVTYSVPTCPPGARCVLTSAAGQNDYYRVSRQLLCSPDGGDYDDPAATCRALRDIVKKLGKHPVCDCIQSQFPPPEAVGFYRGKRRLIPLDWCSLCGGPRVAADLKLLLPQG
jgi:hypothetical protein